jgi:uncharacterized protein (TIGR01777 family)
MRIAITGASGFIGRAVAARLRALGHETCAVSVRTAPSADSLEGCQAVVNLAGEPVAQRWTAEARKRIMDSRVQGTRTLVEAMRAHPPQVLINASAVGYYGSRGDEILTESSAPGSDFTAQVAIAWEREAQAAEALGTRVVRLRIGMVLGPGGGALKKMTLPFRLGLGGPIAGGRHWVSWIHLDDLTSLVGFMLKESTVRGAFNATSPHPVTNSEFTRALGQAVNMPAIIPMPAFALKFLLGEMAELLLASQRVEPEATLNTGFTFEYPDVFGALKLIVDR